jgi:hypothetical protein
MPGTHVWSCSLYTISFLCELLLHGFNSQITIDLAEDIAVGHQLRELAG